MFKVKIKLEREFTVAADGKNEAVHKAYDELSRHLTPANTTVDEIPDPEEKLGFPLKCYVPTTSYDITQFIYKASEFNLSECLRDLPKYSVAASKSEKAERGIYLSRAIYARWPHIIF